MLGEMFQFSPKVYSGVQVRAGHSRCTISTLEHHVLKILTLCTGALWCWSRAGTAGSSEKNVCRMLQHKIILQHTKASYVVCDDSLIRTHIRRCAMVRCPKTFVHVVYVSLFYISQPQVKFYPGHISHSERSLNASQPFWQPFLSK